MRNLGAYTPEGSAPMEHPWLRRVKAVGGGVAVLGAALMADAVEVGSTDMFMNGAEAATAGLVTYGIAKVIEHFQPSPVPPPVS